MATSADLTASLYSHGAGIGIEFLDISAHCLGKV